MPEKPKIAVYWCASCGGCEEAVVDLGTALLDVTAAVDVVFWPVALDFKREDLEQIPDQGIVASLINGAVRNSEQDEMVQLLRRKSQYVIAFGACAQLGGIPGLANLFSREEIIGTAYQNAITLEPGSPLPQQEFRRDGTVLELPELSDPVLALDQVIDVDYYIPGCPPTSNLITGAIQALLTGTLPPKGTVLAPDHALCDECPRKESKPERLELKEIVRPFEIAIDPEKCLLAQGMVCLGGSTRSGCDALCIKGNMPCTGCFGPTSRVRDQGAKSAAAISSIINETEPGEIDRVLNSIPDPLGTFYRYSLPASLLQRSRRPSH